MRAVVVIAYEGPDDPDAMTRLVAAVDDRGIRRPIGGLQAAPVVYIAVDDAADRVVEQFGEPVPG